MTTFQKTLSQRASEAFWSRLSTTQIPQESDLRSATAAVRDTIFRAFDDNDVLQKEFPSLSPQVRGQLSCDLLKLAPPFTLPAPSLSFQLAPWRLALAALLGAFLGLFLLTPFTHYLLKMRDVGLFLGGPLGAFGFVWLSLHLTEDNFLRKAFGATLGVAAATELFLFFQQGSPLSQLWTRLSGQPQQTIGRRLLLYALALLLFILSKKEQNFDRAHYRQQIDAHIAVWVEALLKCISLYHGQSDTNADQNTTQQKLITRLGTLLLQLHQSSQDTLPTIAHEIIIESKNIGFEGLDGEPRFFGKEVPRTQDFATSSPNTFQWTEEHSKEYEIFGAIEPGDRVQEEKAPVVFQGSIQEKGLVRKVRKR